MRPSSPISSLVHALRQRFTAARQAVRGLAEPDHEGPAQRSAESPTVIHYEGRHGILSRCHAIHRRHGNRILFAFGIMEDGGTSPANMIEELATMAWTRFYPKDRFDRIEWFDAWPDHYSLTGRFHIQRVGFYHSKGESGPVWRQVGADVPESFLEEVRRVINARPGLPAAPAVTKEASHG